MDDRSFWASGGHIIRPECDCGEFDYSIDEAREMLAELTAAIADAEQQTAAIVAACADGHDWGSGWNATSAGRKVVVESCKRDGCDGRRELDGWMQFAGQLHVDVMGRQLSCYGPGCDHCDSVKLSKVLNGVLSDAMRQMESSLGTAFIRSTDG